MCRLYATWLLFCLAVVGTQPALAQTTCAPDPAKLGLSRTVVIDAATGPKYGSRFGEKYGDVTFLADQEVVLTFDDGPLRSYTKSILATLAAHCTKATFFMVGRMALADSAMVKEVARQGHTVASHTWSHANLQKQTPLEGQIEIEMGVSAVRHALGKPIAPFFRFAFLRDTEPTLAYAQSRGLATFGIDIDSRDFEAKDAVALSDRVLADVAAKRKGIILLHDIHAATAGALPLLLAGLKERNFKVVHIRAKAPAETVPHYDALAQQEAERLRLAALVQPIAKRTMVWSTKIFSEADAAPAAAKATPPAPRPAARKGVDNPLPATADHP
jgi:peptidoglycan-N-acetylglucosamine deacetylase